MLLFIPLPYNAPLILIHFFSVLESVRSYIDGKAKGWATLVAYQGVDGHHLQIQSVLFGPSDFPSQNQHCTDIIDLLKMQQKIMLDNNTPICFNTHCANYHLTNDLKKWKLLLPGCKSLLHHPQTGCGRCCRLQDWHWWPGFGRHRRAQSVQRWCSCSDTQWRKAGHGILVSPLDTHIDLRVWKRSKREWEQERRWGTD